MIDPKGEMGGEKGFVGEGMDEIWWVNLKEGFFLR
jgi:hypothetical protein